MVGRRLGVRLRFAGDPEPEDPWGEDEQANVQPPTALFQQQAASHHSTLQQASSRQTAANTVSHNSLPTGRTHDEKRSVGPVPSRRSKPSRHVHQHMQEIPSLQKLCLGILGRHVTQLVEQLDGQLGFLPPDAKAALLAVARRRGELTGPVLSALADGEWRQLDLSGCEQLYAAEVLRAAPLMPNIRVLDVTGFEQLLSGGWKQFARAWPSLSVIRLGGGQTCSQEGLKALPHILPGIAQPVAAAAVVGTYSSSSTLQASSSDQTSAAAALVEDEELDSWEDAFTSPSEDDSDCNKNLNSNSLNNSFVTTTSSAAANHADLAAKRVPSSSAAAAAAGVADCRLKQLKALVWPDAPDEAVLLVQQRCPKVLVNPPMKRDKVTGQFPPRELDVSVALDQPYMDLVGDVALQGIYPTGQQQHHQLDHQDFPMLSLADKFRTAYIQQAARLKEKERRQVQQEKRRQLKSSHVLRTLNAWLDEPA